MAATVTVKFTVSETIAVSALIRQEIIRLEEMFTHREGKTQFDSKTSEQAAIKELEALRSALRAIV